MAWGINFIFIVALTLDRQFPECHGFSVFMAGERQRQGSKMILSSSMKNEDGTSPDDVSHTNADTNNDVMIPNEDVLSRDILTMDPSDLEIVFFCDSQSVSCPSDLTSDNLVSRKEVMENNSNNEHSIYPLVDMMRASANYVANHRGTVSVVHIDAASYMNNEEAFQRLMDDLALTWLLGMKLVLVLGCDTPLYEKSECNVGVSYRSSPAPDRDVGWMRFEVERVLNGCIRPHLGLGGDDINGGNVVSSGSFFTAAPYNVGSKDKGYPVELQTRKLQAVLERNDVVLLTSVGLSTSNDVNAELVHVQSETLAAYVASTLMASKLVFVSHNHDINLQNVRTGKTIQNFCLKDAKDILRHYNFQMSQQYVASLTTTDKDQPLEQIQFLFRIGWAALALQNGAERAHIVGPSDGALLTELFTPRDGSATCIVQDGVLQNEEGLLLHPDEDFREAVDVSNVSSNNNNNNSNSKNTNGRKSSLPPPLEYRLF